MYKPKLKIWHLTLLSSILAGVLLTQMRGLWLDEGYTVWFTSHDVPFVHTFVDRWLLDSNPPLYYAYAWMFSPLLAGEVQSFRLINLGILVVPIVTFVICKKEILDKPFFVLFTVSVVSSPVFILYAAELRAYFFMYVLSATLVAQAQLVRRIDVIKPSLLVVMSITIIMLFNIHYMGALVASVVVGSATLWSLLHKKTSIVLWVALSGISGTIMVGGAAFFFLRYSIPGTPRTISSADGFYVISSVLGAALLSSPIVLISAVFNLLSCKIKRHDHTLAWLAGENIIMVVLLFLYNVAQQNILPRYAIGAIPLALALIAEAGLRSRRQPEQLTKWASVFGIVVVVATLGYGLSNKRWERYGPEIAAIASSCPTAQIFAVPATIFMAADAPMRKIPGVQQAFKLSYELVARRYGFHVKVVDAGAEPHYLDPRCPTVVWAEHRFFPGMGDDRLVAASAGLQALAEKNRPIKRDESWGSVLLVFGPGKIDVRKPSSPVL